MAAPERKTVLVLGTHNRQVFGIIGSLHRAGYRVLLGRGGAPGLAEKSCFTAEVWPHAPIADGDEQFLEQLRRLAADRNDLGYIFPTDEPEAAFLAKNDAVLPQGITLVSPQSGAVLTCQDKSAETALATELGIPLAPYHVVQNPREIAEAAAAIGIPFIVRPTHPLGRIHGRKAFICWEESQFDTFFSSWPKGHRDLVVQKYIRGHRTNITFVARDGDVICALQQDTVRTNMADGTGLGCETLTVALDPDLMAHLERLTGHLGYSGVGLLQFMVAEDGSDISFLELNPRFGGGSALPYFMGIDFPRIAIAVAAGRALEPGDEGFDYPVGRMVSSIHLDLSGLVAAIRYREIGLLDAARWFGRAVATFARADADAIWSRRDPMPALYALTLPLRRRRSARS